MKPYRYSPISTKTGLIEAIKYVHKACHKLCEQSFGKYLPTAGNIGIFCHYDSEYQQLTKLREELTEPSDNFNQKYFRLYEPITVVAEGDTPEAVYTYLYIRHPVPDRPQVGDVDFYLEPEDYAKAKELAQKGEISGARIFERPDLDMIELYDPEVDALAYVSTHKMTEKVRIKN